jgi:hypothetical protein
MKNQFQPNERSVTPPSFTNHQPPKKKRRIWIWILLSFFAIILLSAIFSDGDTEKTETISQSEQTSKNVSKDDWTKELLTDLQVKSEYIDSVIPRAKTTTSLDMLRLYVKDMNDIANKTISDSSYMDVYESPEVVKLMEENSKKATKVIPQLGKICRAQYVESIGDKLWEDNIYVELSNDSKTITFIGGIFASNKNIKEWQENVQQGLKDLGFSQVRYKWFKRADEYTYYDL